MKIIQAITLSELGGAQSVVINLSNFLCKEHEVVVVAGDGDGKMFAALNENVRHIKLKRLKRQLSPINDFLTILALRKLYKKEKPDIVHLHSSKIGILGRIAFPKSKIVYTVHGFDSIRVAHRKYLPIEKKLQKFCKAIVGVSKYDEVGMRDEGITHNVTHIYNGISTPALLNENPFKHIEGYKHKVLCIARIAPPKAPDLFIKIASLLKSYAFIWIGNRDDYAVKKPENVFFLGNLPNAGAYCKYADLFILPSGYEGLPVVIIEAMCFGLPIVASDVGGISEIVINSKNGYTVANDPNEFASKIKYILENKDIYDSYSEESLNIFANNLTVQEMTSRYITIYNKK